MPRSHIPSEITNRVRKDAKHRCGYCLSPQKLVMARLEIEHIIPISKGGTDDETNLWLACPICNRHKSNKITGIDPLTEEAIPLFNPRTQDWFAHFRWHNDGILIEGITPTGRATVRALSLSSDPDALAVRSYWVMAGWHPPNE